MNRLLFTITFLIAVYFPFTENQAQVRQWYTTSGKEFIFSFARLDMDGAGEQGNIMRFAPFFNFQTLVNYNFSDNAGFFTGLGIRNVGFIYQEPGSPIKKKYRTYNLGIPIGFKVGKMDGGPFLFGGYELELPINYKEKTFVDNDKTDVFSVWLSRRTPTLAHAPFVGIQFPYGMSVKFKYYLNNFFNKGFSERVGEDMVRPFENFNSNIFYISLSFNLFHNDKIYLKEEMEDKKI